MAIIGRHIFCAFDNRCTFFVGDGAHDVQFRVAACFFISRHNSYCHSSVSYTDSSYQGEPQKPLLEERRLKGRVVALSKCEEKKGRRDAVPYEVNGECQGAIKYGVLGERNVECAVLYEK